MVESPADKTNSAVPGLLTNEERGLDRDRDNYSSSSNNKPTKLSSFSLSSTTKRYSSKGLCSRLPSPTLYSNNSKLR